MLLYVITPAYTYRFQSLSRRKKCWFVYVNVFIVVVRYAMDCVVIDALRFAWKAFYLWLKSSSRMKIVVKVRGTVALRLIENGRIVAEYGGRNDISSAFAISIVNAMRGVSSENKFYYPDQVQLYDPNGNLIKTLTNPTISGMQATWTDTSSQAYTVASVKIIGKNAYDTVTFEIARKTGLNVTKQDIQTLQVIWTVTLSGALLDPAKQIIQDCFRQGFSTRGNANGIMLRNPDGSLALAGAADAGYPTTGTGANYAFCRVQLSFTPASDMTIRYIDAIYYTTSPQFSLWSYQLPSDQTVTANTPYTARTEIQVPWNYSV